MVRQRLGFADNLKVALVAGVILAHVTMAWTGMGTWMFDEPSVREPLLSVLLMSSVIAVLFGMPLFFLVAGMFTPGSLERKGAARFLTDRALRLLLPSVFFVLVLSPPIEYADPDAAGWTHGFWAFIPHIWTDWPPPPGPTWFLGVLFAFSGAYAVARLVRARRPGIRPLGTTYLVATALGVAVSSYLIRLWIPFGEERWHLVVGQAPGWVAGFVLGVFGAERGWFPPLDPLLARRVRHTAWLAVTVLVLLVGAGMATDSGMAVYLGGGTWQSLALAAVEGVIVVTVSLWVLDLFERRAHRQGPLLRGLARAAYAAFLIHQLVLVGLVLGSRRVSWAPELEYVLVAGLGLVLSFGLGALVVRLPGVSRVL